MYQPEKHTRRHRRPEASEYLRKTWGLQYSPRTLAKLAVIGGSPEMQYAGRFPTYTEAALDEWARARLSPPVRSTSERRTFRPRNENPAPLVEAGGAGLVQQVSVQASSI